MKTKSFALNAAMAIVALNFVALSPFIVRLSAERGISQTDSGFLFSASFAGFILFSLIGAAVSSRIGKKRIVTLALFGYAVGFFLFAAVNVFWAECLVMFLLGGCAGIVECLSSALAADLDPKNPEHAVNRLQIYFAVGAVISPLLASVFLQFVPYWKAFYLVLGAFSVFVGWSLHRTDIPLADGGESQHLRLKDLPAILREPGFLLMCLCMAAYTGSEVGAWGWLSSLLQQKMTFTVIESGLTVSLFWLAMTVGRTVSGWLLPRLGVKRLVVILASFSAVVTLAMVFAGQTWLLLTLVAGIGLGCASQFPLISGYGSRLTRLPTGVAFTVLMVCGNVGGMFIPLGMGALGDAVGLDMALLVPVAMFALVAVVMGLYRAKEVRST